MILITSSIFALILLLVKLKLMSNVGDSDAIKRIIIEISLLLFITIFPFISLYFNGK